MVTVAPISLVLDNVVMVACAVMADMTEISMANPKRSSEADGGSGTTVDGKLSKLKSESSGRNCPVSTRPPKPVTVTESSAERMNRPETNRASNAVSASGPAGLLNEESIFLGILDDYWDTFAEGKYRYDAAIVVPDDFEGDDEVNTVLLPGGPVAKQDRTTKRTRS